MIDWIIEVIETVGYLGIVFISALELIIPIIPSEVALPFAGFVASEGSLTLLGVVLASTLGSVIGSIVIYYVAQSFGWTRIIAIVEKYGKILGVKESDVEKAGDYFAKYHYKFVFWGRFIPGVRSVIAVPAGLKKMPLLPFALITAVGSAIWNFALVYAGYRLGEDYTKIEEYIAPVSKIVLALVVLGGLFWLTTIYRTNKKES